MAYETAAPESSAEDQVEAKQAHPRLIYDDADFLAMVRAERLNAIGLDNGDELQDDRERALDYYKGDMSEIPVAANRSKAVHTTVSDMIWQAMPDLVEILMGGSDVGVFKPIGEEDEEAAKQETEVVNNVISNENDGFGLIHDYVHDALLMKAGIFHAWIEKSEEYAQETLQNQTALVVQQLQQQEKAGQIEIIKVEQTGADPMIGPLFSAIISRAKRNTCVKIESAAPEDFAVARDTVNVRDTTYAVLRKRPRAQELKFMGFDPELVDAMPSWAGAVQQQLDVARDTAGESDQPRGASDSAYDLRQVLIFVHVLRVDADGDGKPEIWRIITDEQETVILDKEKLERIPFAFGTPYRQPHRAYGRSLADMSIELQKIMTALLRLHLDGGFFAINARHEINMRQTNEHTLQDYLNNSPGYPVRSNGEALKPLQSTKNDFNALESLEYMATVGETRTGITRNAQGLNPDTLHDTAKGAQALMTNAQKRLRLMARTLAETGIKDLFLLVHALLRTSGADQPMAMRLRNKWVQVDPTEWGERKDFTVEIGMGAGGREMDMQISGMIAGMMDKIVEGQANGAISPPVVTAKNVFAFADWVKDRAGIKKTSFFTDPESEEGQQLAQAAAQPKQDPAVMKIQADAQAKQAEMQLKTEETKANLALTQQKDAASLQAQQQKTELDLQLAREKAAAEIELANKKADAEMSLAWAKFNAEMTLAEAKQNAELALARDQITAQREMHSEKTQASRDMHSEKLETDVHISKNREGGALDE
jgi:hypothetical protein